MGSDGSISCCGMEWEHLLAVGSSGSTPCFRIEWEHFLMGSNRSTFLLWDRMGTPLASGLSGSTSFWD